MKSIDISQWQGKVDWSKIKDQVDFVIIKASTGVNSPDKLVNENAKGAISSGVRFGFYHFATLNNAQDPAGDAQMEAKYFDSIIRQYKTKFPPTIDIEENPSNLKPEQVLLYIKSFINTMKSLGYPRVMLYSYTPFLNQNLPSNHDLGSVPLC